MVSQAKDTSKLASGFEDYTKLTHYSELRKRELTEMLAPVKSIGTLLSF
jgi:hypothetical protein